MSSARALGKMHCRFLGAMRIRHSLYSGMSWQGPGVQVLGMKTVRQWSICSTHVPCQTFPRFGTSVLGLSKVFCTVVQSWQSFRARWWGDIQPCVTRESACHDAVRTDQHLVVSQNKYEGLECQIEDHFQFQLVCSNLALGQHTLAVAQSDRGVCAESLLDGKPL